MSFMSFEEKLPLISLSVLSAKQENNADVSPLSVKENAVVGGVEAVKAVEAVASMIATELAQESTDQFATLMARPIQIIVPLR